MKKIVAGLLIMMMVLSLVACGGSENGGENGGENNNVIENPTPEDIENAIIDAIGADAYYCDKVIDEEEMGLTIMADIDLTKVEAYIGKQNKVTAVCHDCLVVLQCKDGYEDEVIPILNVNYSAICGYVRLYPFGTAKVQAARLYKIRNYVIFVIAGKDLDGDASETEVAENVEAEYAKIDEAIKGIFGELPENLAEEVDD
ncbi:MAG: hypothetical protein IKX99_05175 [Lachnospiraceae bacterium]|nr:hypothetical protein [Lachnospiraceae bacterium]MBR4795610.1 hypothetical protein [Lachnospiraceae bacterium]MBR5789476.1 hypothetical protein [Lachnospiraceae bacterium]